MQLATRSSVAASKRVPACGGRLRSTIARVAQLPREQQTGSNDALEELKRMAAKVAKQSVNRPQKVRICSMLAHAPIAWPAQETPWLADLVSPWAGRECAVQGRADHGERVP
jgi:hypothetical protein